MDENLFKKTLTRVLSGDTNALTTLIEMIQDCEVIVSSDRSVDIESSVFAYKCAFYNLTIPNELLGNRSLITAKTLGWMVLKGKIETIRKVKKNGETVFINTGGGAYIEKGKNVKIDKDGNFTGGDGWIINNYYMDDNR